MLRFKKGDIIDLDFNPQAGHEQKGRRPALVITNNNYNKKCAMIMVAPITHTDKNHPFHVKLVGTETVDGVILCDQAKMLDVYERNAEFIEIAPADITKEAVKLIKSFL